MYAAQLGDFALCSLLLTNGANPNKTDISGRTSLSFAEYCHNDQRRLQTIDILINAGADRKVIDNINQYNYDILN